MFKMRPLCLKDLEDTYDKIMKHRLGDGRTLCQECLVYIDSRIKCSVDELIPFDGSCPDRIQSIDELERKVRQLKNKKNRRKR